MSTVADGPIINYGYKILYRDLICPDKTDEELKKISELEIKENYKCNLNVSVPLGKGFRMKFTCDEFELEGGMGVRVK